MFSSGILVVFLRVFLGFSRFWLFSWGKFMVSRCSLILDRFMEQIRWNNQVLQRGAFWRSLRY